MDDQRSEVVRFARAMSDKGLSPGRSGNVSLREGDAVLITPSGTDYESLKPGDIVEADIGGKVAPDQLEPSKELPLHLAIYKAKPDIRAIVHCHSVAATALACARKPIPAFHYMVAIAGSRSIPLAQYATFGTDALAKNVVSAMKDARACLMANHGQVSCGENLSEALSLAREVEILARQYLDILQFGEAHILDDEEMDRVLERFKTYGQRPRS